MSDAMMSSYSNYNGTNLTGNTASARSLYQLGVASQGAPQTMTQQTMTQGDGKMVPLLSVQPIDETLLVPDKTVAEATIRQLRREIGYAREELRDLEQTLVQELLTPTVREWLLPLMAIGLALSLYGSFSAGNTAELGATGMMLLWSLSAFWFIYTRDRRLEMAKRANKAEIEIWSRRIDELQQSLDQNQRIVKSGEE
jgi:hypothetical protein